MVRQLRKGEAAEAYLDRYFLPDFTIQRATPEEQRQGIDRRFTRLSDGKEFKVEYKADKTAAKTGNAFVETVSVDTQKIPGWAFTCQADFIVYYVVGTRQLYILRPADIRQYLPQWAAQYPERRIPNGKYHTIGLLVPLSEFAQAAVRTLYL